MPVKTAKLTWATGDNNPQAWSGNCPLPITAAGLGSVLADVVENDGSIRCYSDAAKTTELPVEVVYAQPQWFSLSATKRGNYGLLIFPAALRDAATGCTYHVFLGAGHAIWLHWYDEATEVWSDPVKVGVGVYNATSNDYADTHGNPSIEEDSSGVWHIFGGCHNTACKHWTASDPQGAWTEQTDVGTAETYPAQLRVGNDLALVLRNNGAGEMPTQMRLQSASTSFATAVEIANLSDGGPANPTDPTGTRTYHWWAEVDGPEVHFILVYHQDSGTTAADELRNYVFHAVLECTLDGSGYVSAWRWKDIAGNYLAAATTALTWSMVTTSQPANTWIAGLSSSSNALIQGVTDTSKYQYLPSSIALDDNGYPHFLVRQFTASDASTADLHYVRWSGSAWSSSLVYTADAIAGFRSYAITATSASDITVLGARADSSSPADTYFVKLVWNGTTWSETQYTTTPAPSATFGAAGCAIFDAIGVKGHTTTGPAALYQISDFDGGAAGQEYGALPWFAVKSNGDRLASNRFLAYVLAPVPASGNTEVWMEYGDDTASLPAADATYGSQAVWADYDAVVHPEQPYIAHGSLYPTAESFPQSSKTNGNGLGWYGFVGTSSFGAGCQLLPCGPGWGICADNNNDTALPSGYPTLKLYGAASNMPAWTAATVQISALRATPQSVTQGGSINRADESIVTSYVISGLTTVETSPVVRSVMRNNTNTYTQNSAVIDPYAAVGAATVLSDTQTWAVANGVQSDPLTVTTPLWSGLDVTRLFQLRRSSGDIMYSGVIGEYRCATAQTAGDWTGGRLEVETYSIYAANDTDYFSALDVTPSSLPTLTNPVGFNITSSGFQPRVTATYS